MVGDLDTSVNYIRMGAGTGSCVVGVSEVFWQWGRELFGARYAGKAPRWDGLLSHDVGCKNHLVRLDVGDLYSTIQSAKCPLRRVGGRVRGSETHLFPGLNIVLEAFINGRNVRIQVLEVESLADTGKLRSVALGAGGGGLGVRRVCPLAVLIAHILGYMMLEHNNVLVGDDLGGD